MQAAPLRASEERQFHRQTAVRSSDTSPSLDRSCATGEKLCGLLATLLIWVLKNARATCPLLHSHLSCLQAVQDHHRRTKKSFGDAIASLSVRHGHAGIHPVFLKHKELNKGGVQRKNNFQFSDVWEQARLLHRYMR